MHTACYAKSGGPIHLQWQKLDKAKSGMEWEQFLHAIGTLPRTIDGETLLWRHNAAGDLPGVGEALDIEALDQLVTANDGRAGFTYTHKALNAEGEKEAIKRANARGFTINLSAHGPADADAKADLGIGPVVTVMPVDAPQRHRTPGGRLIITCPAYTQVGMTCHTCRACAIPDRKSIIGFPLHGQRKYKMEIPMT